MKPTAPRRARKCWAVSGCDYLSFTHTGMGRQDKPMLLIPWDKASRDALAERIARVIMAETLKAVHDDGYTPDATAKAVLAALAK